MSAAVTGMAASAAAQDRPPWTRLQGLAYNRTLKTLTSLNKEVRAVFPRRQLAFGDFPLFLPLAIPAFGSPEGCFSLAIIAFGAFEYIVPKCYCRLGKRGNEGV